MRLALPIVQWRCGNMRYIRRVQGSCYSWPGVPRRRVASASAAPVRAFNEQESGFMLQAGQACLDAGRLQRRQRFSGAQMSLR